MPSVRRHESLLDESDTMTIERIWLGMPIALRAVLTGVTVAAAGTVPWAWLVSANITHESALPWSVPIMAIYLWLYWLFVRGGDGPGRLPRRDVLTPAPTAYPAKSGAQPCCPGCSAW